MKKSTILTIALIVVLAALAVLAGAALAHGLGREVAVADDQLVAVAHLGQDLQKLRRQYR